MGLFGGDSKTISKTDQTDNSQAVSDGSTGVSVSGNDNAVNIADAGIISDGLETVAGMSQASMALAQQTTTQAFESSQRLQDTMTAANSNADGAQSIMKFMGLAILVVGGVAIMGVWKK